MGTRRRRGFTLIELLVVIAIIGILAAMLFPVFARARESARKTQCLANVKNLAIAINMYLTDYDRFPPSEKRVEAMNYFAGEPGGGGEKNCKYSDKGDDGAWWAANIDNPYLQWPVILDDYVKNRDVWRCPSAKMESSAMFIYNDGGDWLGYLSRNNGNWGASSGIGPTCTHMAFPSGWGGAITDSIAQQALGGGSARDGQTGKEVGVFIQSIGAAKENLSDASTSAYQDAAKLIVFADQAPTPDWLSIPRIAYPDICCAECSGVSLALWNWPDPNGCPDGTYCPECVPVHANINWAKDPTTQKSSARHLGGSNVGFGDGHAKWYAARSVIADSDSHLFEGVGWTCEDHTSANGFPYAVDATGASCGGVKPGMIFLHSERIGWNGG